MARVNASAGHRLGQVVGDWFEEYMVLPLIERVGDALELFVDSRFVKRSVRPGKIVWADADGNEVDYDFVLELDGSTDARGIPVAFIESCWRRGARHSKDKARDDSGKLLPMRETYPTARFLGMVAGGDFTKPARDLVRSRDIELFYIPKGKIVQAFSEEGFTIDYPDTLPEREKAKIVRPLASTKFKREKQQRIRDRLIELVGKPSIDSFVQRVRSVLSALPQEIRLIVRHDSSPLRFESVQAASEYLAAPNLAMSDPTESYVYEITYTDGSEFERNVAELAALKQLHEEIAVLTKHMSRLGVINAS
ncbi:MAG: hypothetical protein IH624_20290 [Phycisphaerae bacterium]|nr:hypothetical protein [Phycisphaerae bacterium]